MSAARVIAVVNQKGGTGKTTTAVNLAGGLARRGRKVLLIDMDPQAGLTCSMGLEAKDIKPTIYEVLMGRAGLAEAILKHEYPGGSYDFIPANWNLEAAELDLDGVKGRELQLQKSIGGAKKVYDYILIDGGPRLNILAMNSLYAAGEAIIPLDSKYLALNGLLMILDAVKLMNEEMKRNLKPAVLLTRYSDRQALAREVEKIIRESFRVPIFNSRIRDNVSLAEAPSYGQDIFEYKAASNGAKDYGAFVEEILAQEGRA